MYQSFEDLEVWRVSLDLSVEVYEVLKTCRDYGLKDQLCRSAVSVPSNIAEGMERHSLKETVHFLHIAKGSCAEMRTQLMIAARIGYIEQAKADQMIECAKCISRMLQGLVRSLEEKGDR